MLKLVRINDFLYVIGNVFLSYNVPRILGLIERKTERVRCVSVGNPDIPRFFKQYYGVHIFAGCFFYRSH